jgi:hypothetical protein
MKHANAMAISQVQLYSTAVPLKQKELLPITKKKKMHFFPKIIA